MTRTSYIYEAILDDITADDLSRNTSKQLADASNDLKHQTDSYFDTDVYIEIDYRRFFEFPPLLTQFKEAMTYQLQQFPEFTFSGVRIITTNEIYHHNDRGISELATDKARLYNGDYHFVFAYKYERTDAA